MLLGLFTCILCNYFIFSYIILPIAIAFGIKFYIKYSRGKVDVTNEVDIFGKTVIVTGASDGIGKVTAEELAIRGARVIMACRNFKKAEDAVWDIRKSTANGELIVMHLDLSSLSSVRSFAAEYISKYGGPSSPGLSILINNAGKMNAPGVLNYTDDGLEEVLQVNHLGPFLLTNLLLPEIERAAEGGSHAARIVNVSSMAHMEGTLNFEDLNFRKTPLKEKLSFNLSQLYANSKLANNLFNLELAKRLRARKLNINSYALCPGFVMTNIFTEVEKEITMAPHLKYILGPLLQFFVVKNAKEGTETTIYCALSKYLEHHSGEMYRNCQFWDYSQRLKLKEEDAALFWEKSAELVKL